MRDYRCRERTQITAGAITAVVIVGLMAVVLLALVWTPPS